MTGFLGDWRRTRYAGDLSPEDDGKEVVLAGWIEDVRNLGGIAFIRLRDRSGWAQITAFKREDRELFKHFTSLSRESVVAIRGKVVRSDQAKMGFEVHLKDLRVLSRADVPLPLGVADRVHADLDTRLDNRFLDLRKPWISRIFRFRSRILEGMRSYLLDQGFVEVSTPKIVATATEGGTDLFPVDYFGKRAYLNQSPQLYKQILMASGLDRVLEIGPAFRAEAHDTTRHLNEYISVDIEMAFADENDAMDILEGTIRAAHSAIEKGCVPEDPFPRYTYDEILELVRHRGIQAEWGQDLSADSLRAAGEEIDGYYFITKWPIETKPFYAQPFDGRLCRAFDLMNGQVEIASGAERVHDHGLLVCRLKEQGLNPEDFEFYLRAFRYGMPQHAGWGLGLERLIMVMLDLTNVRECVLFPRDLRRLVP